MMAAAPPQLRAFKPTRVVLGDPDDESTWVEHVVRAMPMDLRRAEEQMRRRKVKIGDAMVAVELMQTYYALQRTGALDAETSYDDFEAVLLDFAPGGTEPVDPTGPAPGPDSS